MSQVQVLVTTMHQKDLSKYKQMNLQTDAVIANQADKNETIETEIEGNRVRFVTTNTIGVSKNRNIAIDNRFEDKYLMFSDDDLVFHDGYESKVLQEFNKHPEADAIKFNLNCISERKLSVNAIENFHRLGRSEVSSDGVCALVFREEVLRKVHISFNERFGPGTAHYCGEDTIFLQKTFKDKIRLYASPVYIADIDQSVSSWFKGYEEEFFTTAGIVISECYPFLCYFIVIRSAYKFYKRCRGKFSITTLLRYYYSGIAKNKTEKRNAV